MSITKISPSVVDPNSVLDDESEEVKQLAEIVFNEEAKAKHKAHSESGGLA